MLASYEATAPRGLEDVTAGEIAERLGQGVVVRPVAQGTVSFDFSGSTSVLLTLRTAISLYRVQRFAVPRPRALLGDQNLRLLLESIDKVVASAPADYRTLHLSAAGRHSPMMRRLVAAIAAHSSLQPGEDEGDLQMRVRPAEAGWDVLIRLTPRPLATRSWRVCNRPGALNAAIAACMVLLTDPQPTDSFLNSTCGSGTIAIERAIMAETRRIMARDVDPEAVRCTRQNVQAAGCKRKVDIASWDARSLPLPDASVDEYCSDFPFGHRVGSHTENRVLHVEILAEAARVCRPGALCCILHPDPSVRRDRFCPP